MKIETVKTKKEKRGLRKNIKKKKKTSKKKKNGGVRSVPVIVI